jgi:excisionase family DNA binding protein
MNDKLLTLSEVSAMVRRGEWTVRNWIKQGRFIEPYRIGGRFMFKEADLLAFIEASGKGVTNAN